MLVYQRVTAWACLKMQHPKIHWLIMIRGGMPSMPSLPIKQGTHMVVSIHPISCELNDHADDSSHSSPCCPWQRLQTEAFTQEERTFMHNSIIFHPL